MLTGISGSKTVLSIATMRSSSSRNSFIINEELGMRSEECLNF